MHGLCRKVTLFSQLYQSGFKMLGRKNITYAGQHRRPTKAEAARGHYDGADVMARFVRLHGRTTHTSRASGAFFLLRKAVLVGNVARGLFPCLLLTNAMLLVSCGLLTPMASFKIQELDVGNKLTVTKGEKRRKGGIS